MNKTYLFVSWFIALAAMLGSLYYSEIRGLAPCVLCWYQRILMYPQVLLLGLAIVKNDRGIADYILLLNDDTVVSPDFLKVLGMMKNKWGGGVARPAGEV